MGTFREFEYEGWQAAADHYHAAWSELTSRTIPSIMDALKPAGRFLDLASGPGYVAAAAPAWAVALDFSPAMVARGAAAYPHLNFLVGDAERLPFADGSFDAVGMNLGLLHLGEPETAIAEAFRVLRSGGRFAFTVWSDPTAAQGFQLVLDAVARHGAPVTVPRGPDFFRYSRTSECLDALAAVGFVDATTTVVDLRWEPPDVAAIFPSFLHGTARTGALLRQQEPAAQRAIARDIAERAQRFVRPDGRVVIPMPAVLACGVRPPAPPTRP
ncbi:methyltransferase domain-containing protein [Asanoa sp. NPDC050611]|uniref:class I SAM-dependent methyltransferase n=1 Tax=Asanoa sp. NPDC050611 TaxID=3157098 RepID=UPI00340C7A23